MANQAEAGAMEGASTGATTREAATMHGGSTEITARGSAAATEPYPSYHGRTVSWVAVGIMMAGFLIGGLALVFGSHGPIWWLFWVGAAVTVVGLLTSVATNTFEDWY